MMIVCGSPAARDDEEFTARANGGDWRIAWHPPTGAPPGNGHGANGFCVTVERGLCSSATTASTGVGRVAGLKAMSPGSRLCAGRS